MHDHNQIRAQIQVEKNATVENSPGLPYQVYTYIYLIP